MRGLSCIALLCLLMQPVLSEMDNDQEVPPLVTASSIAEAKKILKGTPIQLQPIQALPAGVLQGSVPLIRPWSPAGASRIQASAPKHVYMLAESAPSAFAGIPPWVFILTFVGSVGAIVIMFYIAERSKSLSVFYFPFDCNSAVHCGDAVWARRQEMSS